MSSLGASAYKGSWPGGHLVTWVLWVPMHINEIVRRTVPFSDKCILLSDING